MRLLKPLLPRLSFILIPLYKWYASKDRNYRFRDIKIKISSGVFHPGLFFSTKALIDYLESIDLKNKRLLELGCGSGLISIVTAKLGAVVTASDINPKSIRCASENALNNDVSIQFVISDLFDELSPADFDIIVINPPYFPKKVNSDFDLAWNCGEDFEYFQKLFTQLNVQINPTTDVIIVLSEHCDITSIRQLAGEKKLTMVAIKKIFSSIEENLIFKIRLG